METKSLGFIGGGRITKIFLHGLSNRNALPVSIKVFDPNEEILEALQTSFPDVVAAGSAADAATQELVIIAVHPPVFRKILPEIKDAISETTVVISLAPKITLESLTSALPTKNHVRMIPNATSYINEGYNPITFAPECSAFEKRSVLDFLSSLGRTFEVQETKLEAYALVSAMLPTYFWFQWNKIENLGEQMGLSASESKETIHQTLLAAIDLYFNSGLSIEEINDLIPAKPIGERESQISEIYQTKLIGLYQKIKP